MTALLRQLVATFPQAVRKLDPRHTIRHPIVFVVWVSSAVTTVTAIMRPTGFTWLVAVWLWATVLFATMAEAVAEARAGAGRRPARHQTRHVGPTSPAGRPKRRGRRCRAAGRRPRARWPRRSDPRRRRRRRGDGHCR